VVGGRLFILAAEDPEEGAKEYALCLDPASGKEVWKTNLGNLPGTYDHGWGSGPRSTPTVDGDFVYVLGAMGDLLCLKAADGERVWRVNLVKDFGGQVPTWGYSESVLIDSDRLVCTPGGDHGTMLALDKKTGKKLWQSEELTDPAGYASVVVADVGGVRQYVTQTMQSSCGVRASDGRKLWRQAGLKRGVAVIPTPVVHDGYAFFTAGYGAGCELLKLEPDGTGGTRAPRVYTNNVVTNHHGGVVRVGNYLFGHTDTGNQWVCYDYLKGEDDPVWKSNKLEKGSIAYADGHLYCYGQRKGTLVRIKATDRGWEEAGRFDIPQHSQYPRRSGLIWTHPVIANGMLYLRDHELLFCYDLRGKKAG